MRITLDELNEYGDNLASIAEEANAEFRRMIAEYMSGMPDFSIWSTEQKAGLANYAAEAMNELWKSYGSASCALGMTQLDSWLDGGLPEWPDVQAPGDAKAAIESADYWKKFLFGRDGRPGDVNKFIDGCCSFIDRKVSHAADVQMAELAQKLGKDGMAIRYARVPVGPTCGFCIMLASRGFDYTSKKSAGDIGAKYNSFHNGCNCRVVAGHDGLEVEGYDPDGLYDRYLQCRKTIGDTEQLLEDWDNLPPEERDKYGRGDRAIPLSDNPSEEAKLLRKLGKQANGFNDYVAHRIVQEMDTRDREWLYSGTKLPSPEKEEGAKPKKKEAEAANILQSNGYKVRFRTPTGEGRTSDIYLISGSTREPTDTRWEIKQPIGNKEHKSIGKNTIDHQFEDAIGQSRNLVLDASIITTYPGITFEAVITEADRLLSGKYHNDFDEILIIGRNQIRKIKNR